MVDFAKDDTFMKFDNEWTARGATDHLPGKKRVYDKRYYIFDNNDVVRFGISIDSNNKIDEISRGNESYLKKNNLERMPDDNVRAMVSEFMTKTNTGVHDSVALMNPDKFIANQYSRIRSFKEIPSEVNDVRMHGTNFSDFMDIPDNIKHLTLKGISPIKMNIGKNLETLNIESEKLEKLAKEGNLYLHPESKLEISDKIKRAGNKAWERQFGNREDMFSRIKNLLKGKKKEDTKENTPTTNAPSQKQSSKRGGIEM